MRGADSIIVWFQGWSMNIQARIMEALGYL